MVGTTISHYKVIEKIGQGGMGEVYRAEDTNLSRDVTIKVVPDFLKKDLTAKKRFLREAKSAATSKMGSLIFLLLALLCSPTEVNRLFAQGDVSFIARGPFGVGDHPHSATVGDFNGDTIQDLAVPNFASDNVSILLGQGDGTFLSAQHFGVGDGFNGCASVAVGDFNGDTIQDLAVANELTDNVSILLGQGDGTFLSAQHFGVGHGQHSVTVGDFNGDTIQDLATANEFSANVSILLGQGDGTFLTAQDFGVGDGPYSVTVGDFNGDAIQDLATANANSNDVSILLGQGDGTFLSAQFFFGVGAHPASVTVGDFNGDTIQDLVTADAGSDNVSILLGQGDGTFFFAPFFELVGDEPLSVTVGDFNGDSIEDLAVANAKSDDVSILLGQGDGTFLSAQFFRVGGNPYSVTVGDFNGDTIQDLATANANSDSVSILLGIKLDSTVLVANFVNGNNVAFNSRVYLWNPSTTPGEVTVRVFTLPVIGGLAQELTSTPLSLGTLGARSALNLKLVEDILTALGLTTPYTDNGGNLTLEFTIQAANVGGVAQVFSDSLAFGTYPLQEIPSASTGSPTVLVANFTNGNNAFLNSRLYLWNPSQSAGSVTVRAYTLPSSGPSILLGTPEFSLFTADLGLLDARSSLNIKIAEDVLSALGIPLPYTDDGGNLTIEVTVGAENVRGVAQVFSSGLAYGTYPMQVIQ